MNPRTSSARRTSLALLATAAVLGIPAAASTAYVEISVPDGGRVSGAVRYSGPLVPPIDVAVTADQAVCHESVVSHVFRLGATRGLRDVIVTFEGITSGKAIPVKTDLLLTNRACQFEPHAQAVTVGSKVQIGNDDPVLHNVHAIAANGQTFFNVALPMKGFRIPKIFGEPGLVTVQCDAGHTWMKAYVLVLDHPYSAVTDSTGAFSISDIPPGSYRVKAWHEAAGTLEQDVVIRPAEQAEILFDYSSPPTLPAITPPPPPPPPEEDEE